MVRTTLPYFARINTNRNEIISNLDRPLITLSILLLLPSIMTLLTLIVHRIRQSRAERRERAPESIVASLPTGVWTGEGLLFDDADKEAGVVAHPESRQPATDGVLEAAAQTVAKEGAGVDGAVKEDGIDAASPIRGTDSQESRVLANVHDQTTAASTSTPIFTPPTQQRRPIANGRKYLKKAWFATQTECAICLGDFEKGDKLRILPCGHIFHTEEVDAWLIQRKKLVSLR